MDYVIPVLVLCAWITFVVVCSALYVTIVGGLFVYRYGIKLREYKPQGFLISDIAAGAYKVKQRNDGTLEITPNSGEDEEVDDGLATEDEFEEWMAR